jgi:hypothetical protein
LSGVFLEQKNWDDIRRDSFTHFSGELNSGALPRNRIRRYFCEREQRPGEAMQKDFAGGI